MGGDTLPDLILPKEEGLLRDERVGGSLGCSDHEIVKLGILRGRKRANGRTTTQQTLAHTGTNLAESHGILSWKEKWPRRAG